MLHDMLARVFVWSCTCCVFVPVSHVDVRGYLLEVMERVCSWRLCAVRCACMQVQDALKEEMGSIHALSIKQTWTPAQQAAATSS